MNANINFQQVISALKSAVGLASLAMITVGILRALCIGRLHQPVKGWTGPYL